MKTYTERDKTKAALALIAAEKRLALLEKREQNAIRAANEARWQLLNAQKRAIETEGE